MKQFLHNLSVKGGLTVVLCLFTLLILGVAGMGHVTNQQGQRTITNIDRLNADLIKPINRTRINIADAMLYMQQFINDSDSGKAEATRKALAESLVAFERADTFFTRYLNTPKDSEQGRQFEADIKVAYDQLINEGLGRQHDALKQGDISAFRALAPKVEAMKKEFRQISQGLMDYSDKRGNAFMADYANQTDTAEIAELVVLLLAAAIVLLVRMGMIRTVITPLQEAVQHFERIAQGDLSHKIQDYGRNEIGQLFSAMGNMQNGLTKTVSTVRNSSGSIHIGSREIASGNTDLSSRTEEQAAALQETAASMEELTTTVKQNADNARQGSTLAKEASTTATRGGEVVGEVITTMQGITASSKQVTDIISVIDSIAFQTNILALNASVEAARAGEQGRGFAVVASEVRNLASRSADAAKEIKALIETSAAQIDQGSALVESAGGTMRDIVESVRRVTDIMDEISSASQEQSSGIEQVNQAITQMDEVTQQNASLVEEAAAAASSLEEQAAQLETAVSIFRLPDGTANTSQPPATVNEPRAIPSSGTLTQKSAAEKQPTAKRAAAKADELEWEEF
ncbi:methyl-accepting chemotaxis protein [Halomonas sp. M20]|uniref:methyl-accepting chemotaxis protein n=1 Tax=Halomonas sp. M20 TaxID=2763264 RepID=UPI0029CAC1FF|nr:methyl-accepting chemotaxis protein [Halomonas sp. M20]